MSGDGLAVRSERCPQRAAHDASEFEELLNHHPEIIPADWYKPDEAEDA